MSRESVEQEQADRERGELAVGESGVDASIEIEYTKPIPRPDAHSQPFFDGDYKVLRGGSWAVAADILRPSFRNWDHPIRRRIFSGIRLAWDA